MECLIILNVCKEGGVAQADVCPDGHTAHTDSRKDWTHERSSVTSPVHDVLPLSAVSPASSSISPSTPFTAFALNILPPPPPPPRQDNRRIVGSLCRPSDDPPTPLRSSVDTGAGDRGRSPAEFAVVAETVGGREDVGSVVLR